MGMNPKRQRFVEEYLIDHNATQAAIRAGYSKKTAHSQGPRLLENAEVQAAIQAGQEKLAEKAGISAKDVLQRWQELAFADPNELVSVRVGSCRHCHGTDHMYQWRDEAEFELAQESHWDLPDDKRTKRKAPVIGGGFGYKWAKPPHPDCPNCEGMGRQRTVLRDTTELSAGGRALYAGAKETMAGVEIKMHDQMAALERIARHLGMFPSKVELTGKDGGPIKTVTTEMTPQEAAEAYQATLGDE